MSNVKLLQNFLANARGLTFVDGGGVTWSFDPNANALSAVVSGTGITPGSVTNADLANMASNTIKGNATGGAAAPQDLNAASVKTLLSLNLVENTALSTWSGSANLVTLGTVTTGVWNGTAIASGNIAAALTGKTYNGLTLTAQAVGFTIAGGTTPETLTVGANASVAGTNTGDQILPTAANPTGSVGLAAVNGTAATFMRSDGAPALSVAISPTWTGNHTFTPGSGVALTLNGTAASQIGIFVGTAGNCYFDYKRVAVLIGRVGSADSIVAAGAITDFAISAPAGGINFATGGSSASRMFISSTGAVSIATTLGINGATPPSQVTGWGTPAAPAVVAAFPATPTLGQCGQAIGKIIADLKAFGIYGA